MTNFVQKGDTLTFTAPYAVSSGGGALIGSIFGIACQDLASGASGEFYVGSGVVTHAKTSAQAWIAGSTLIYWDDTNKVMTSTSTSNKLIGAAVAAAANPSSTGTVRLNGAFIS
jgi:predicted RecA/RadA family phage recombinase